MADITVFLADYSNPVHADAIISMLDVYARDPMGGGAPLSDYTRKNLVSGLVQTPGAFSVLAFHGEAPAGLANCFTSFSTFAAKPLVNIHDVVVDARMRGQGIGKRLFKKIEMVAVEKHACKVTLEVLSGNETAKGLYAALGYGDYELDPSKGHALFWQKALAS
ncbi:GNAT family N-acetyltransferase [Pontixanthobacter aestiaquae]|uniref:GNAT family N-acetyltransferase n=1 Tax=Pontixanthobacter aestiaquae TaxID=1509367 RepID=A0A844Z2L3_9SPHN|nr:GNAT family N-acetyltransferase [Pontixanthobacter aestiaquae]MDN3646843.1 GNAT family N-acetyltransferase [Pontixanthobacter aestiaquae]MXO82175.1 GNAT family N-acetyltransferase [Pontixanthobacter aestiaquae]